MGAKRKLVFLGQLGVPGRYDPAVFDNQPGGDDEVHWFGLMLERLGLTDQIDYQGYHLCRGEAVPDLDAADAYVVGGSFHSVNDDLPYQQALKQWLAAQWARPTPPPVFGICGGHQIISQMMGYPVGAVSEGVRAGTMPVELTDAGRASPLFDGIVPRFLFGNEEHVLETPAGATVLATTSVMPNCALDYGRGWSSVQFHPEATASCMTESWGDKAKDYESRYEPTPDAPRMFVNFLKANGVL